MRLGMREICDVVLKAKTAQKIGNKIFYKGEPVIYFDTLKASSMEGAATTVYATGGRGNSRLIAWEGERTVTFTMEDALISPAGFMILSGAGLVEANENETIKVHVVEQTDDVTVTAGGQVEIEVDQVPYTRDGEDMVYVMLMDNGEVSSEPYIPATIVEKEADATHDTPYGLLTLKDSDDVDKFVTGCVVLVDYYTEKKSGVQQINITPDKFGGNYYLEASTLFRDQAGVDHPAEFIIPNCKVQSNFTFTMAATGDPSTFTFTMDAFPDYTRFNKTKKVLAAIQVFDGENAVELTRQRTKSTDVVDDYDRVIRPTGD